jgi:hypothetical protein
MYGLQASLPYEGVTNFAIASVPDHPFWDRVISIVGERADIKIDSTARVIEGTGE